MGLSLATMASEQPSADHGTGNRLNLGSGLFGSSLGFYPSSLHRATLQRGQETQLVTFLPSPDGDGVLWIHAHGHQELPSCTEVDIIHPLGVEAPEHGKGVFGHGVPDVN